MKRINVSAIAGAAMLLLILGGSSVMMIVAAWETLDIENLLCTLYLVAMTAIIVGGFATQVHVSLQYDEEKLVAKYLAGKPVTVWKNRTVFYRISYSRDSRYYIVGNVPTLSLRFTNRTAVELSETEFKKAMADCRCIPVEQAYWDELTAESLEQEGIYAGNGRIFIAPKYLLHFLGYECLLVGAIVFSFLLLNLSDEGEFLFVVIELLLFFILPAVVGVLYILRDRRFLATVSLCGNELTASLLGKVQCTVDMSAPIYYAVFRGNEYGTKNVPFIVVSNQWFNYYKVNEDNKSYLSKYDTATQVVFPYNGDTAPFCRFDDWKCVGGFGELNRHRKISEE